MFFLRLSALLSLPLTPGSSFERSVDPSSYKLFIGGLTEVISVGALNTCEGCRISLVPRRELPVARRIWSYLLYISVLARDQPRLGPRHGYRSEPGANPTRQSTHSLEHRPSRIADLLEAHFAKYGEILEAAIITDRWGLTKGFGFVTFKDEPSMAAALAQEEHAINGVLVEVKRSTHGEPESSTSKKAFVGGIGPSVTEEKLQEYFSAFGNVSDVQVMYDYVSGRSRGFGFVTFEDDKSLQRCMEKGAHVLMGQAVDVKAALPRPGDNGASRSGMAHRPNGRGGHSSHSSHSSYGSHSSHGSHGSYGVPGSYGIPGSLTRQVSHGSHESHGSHGQDGVVGMGYSQGYGFYAYPYMANFRQYPMMGQYHPGMGYAPHGVGGAATHSGRQVGQMPYDPTLVHAPFMIVPTGHADASSSLSSRRSSESPSKRSDDAGGAVPALK